MLYNPIYEFDRMRSLLDDLFNVSVQEKAGNEELEFANVYESPNGYMLQFLTPGVKSEDIEVNCTDGVMSVNIKRVLDRNEKKDIRFLRQERSSSEFTRSYRLSDDADTEKIEAKVMNGILMVFIPKKEKAKLKKISVKVN